MTTPTNDTAAMDELRQKLAAIEHERWSDWQKWMHGTLYTVVDDKNVTHWCLPPELIDRWEGQIATPYDQLSEAKKASDMEQVDRYWPLIEQYGQEVAREAQEKAEYWQQFGEHYEVSTLGRVRRNGKILKQSDRDGYRTLTLSIDNKQQTMLVHRMVALRFLPNPENKPQVNHIDGNKANNIVTNLEWCTSGENEQHSYTVLGKQTWNKNKAVYETLKCLECGNEFQARKWRKAKFCSQSCQITKKHRDKREAKALTLQDTPGMGGLEEVSDGEQR